jgi:hypothetical protein
VEKRVYRESEQVSNRREKTYQRITWIKQMENNKNETAFRTFVPKFSGSI